MKRREFGQFCGLARALELVGERWTLLLVRELLARPCRYTDLQQNLPGIPTNVLSTRLKELEAEGIVERQVAPAPQRGVVYRITPDGERLEPAVIALARWGNGHLGERDHEIVPASTIALAFRATFNAKAAGDVAATWEIRAADVVLYVRVEDGTVTTGVGAAPTEPDLVMTFAAGAEDVPTFRDILAALKAGEADLTGRKSLAAVFLKTFTPAATTA